MGHFKDGILVACDEVCEKKRERRSKVDMWWWNDEVKDAVLGKKQAHKAMYQHSTEVLVKGLKTDSKEVEEGTCMRGSDGKLCYSEKDRGNVWKDYNEENDWDHNVEGDAVEGPVVCIGREIALQALTEINTGKAPGLSLELIAASGGVGIEVMAEICQSVLDGFEMPVD